mmetsp:Transcript_34318/g.65557  ORF Transcript_34318/g.65557 Transcript_34318/m.65557 type:complete len:592 (-) Transcript_34318:31-1806(-)
MVPVQRHRDGVACRAVKVLLVPSRVLDQVSAISHVRDLYRHRPPGVHLHRKHVSAHGPRVAKPIPGNHEEGGWLPRDGDADDAVSHGRATPGQRFGRNAVDKYWIAVLYPGFAVLCLHGGVLLRGGDQELVPPLVHGRVAHGVRPGVVVVVNHLRVNGLAVRPGDLHLELVSARDQPIPKTVLGQNLELSGVAGNQLTLAAVPRARAHLGHHVVRVHLQLKGAAHHSLVLDGAVPLGLLAVHGERHHAHALGGVRHVVRAVALVHHLAPHLRLGRAVAHVRHHPHNELRASGAQFVPKLVPAGDHKLGRVAHVPPPGERLSHAVAPLDAQRRRLGDDEKRAALHVPPVEEDLQLVQSGQRCGVGARPGAVGGVALLAHGHAELDAIHPRAREGDLDVLLGRLGAVPEAVARVHAEVSQRAAHRAVEPSPRHHTHGRDAGARLRQHPHRAVLDVVAPGVGDLEGVGALHHRGELHAVGAVALVRNVALLLHGRAHKRLLAIHARHQPHFEVVPGSVHELAAHVARVEGHLGHGTSGGNDEAPPCVLGDGWAGDGGGGGEALAVVHQRRGVRVPPAGEVVREHQRHPFFGAEV